MVVTANCEGYEPENESCGYWADEPPPDYQAEYSDFKPTAYELPTYRRKRRRPTPKLQLLPSTKGRQPQKIQPQLPKRHLRVVSLSSVSLDSEKTSEAFATLEASALRQAIVYLEHAAMNALQEKTPKELSEDMLYLRRGANALRRLVRKVVKFEESEKRVSKSPNLTLIGFDE